MLKKIGLPAGKAGKKSFLYLSVIIIAAILVCVGFFYFLSKMPEIEKGEVMPEKSEKEKIIEQQLKELDQLRGDAQPLTEEEIQKQLEELDKLH